MTDLEPHITIDQIRDKVLDKLLHTGWDQRLRFFTKSSDFYDIILSLYHEKDMNKRFSPGLQNVFKAFELCHFKDLKVIFLGNEPNTDPTVNNGMTISHNFGLTGQIEFRAFYEELQRTVGDNSLLNADLSGWAKQGILLLNTTLTTRVGYIGQHRKIWEPWTNYLLDILNREEKLVWVFFGENPYFDSIDNPNHTIIKVPPLPNKRKIIWDSNNVFNNTNKELLLKNKKPIIW